MTDRKAKPSSGRQGNHSKVSPARAATFAILERVGNSSAHSDDLLHGVGMAGLSQADRNLATTLVLGVLRWQIALDARIRPLLQRPEMELASPVATALRLGAFQLLHLDRIPAHAALSESVELARAAGQEHAAGMVNAVLRNLTRQGPVKAKLVETTGAMAERLGHPGWLVERWVLAYGRAAARAVCEYDQRPPGRGVLFAAETAGASGGSRSSVVVEAHVPEAGGGAPGFPATHVPGAGHGAPESFAASRNEGEGVAEAEGGAEDSLPVMDDGSRLVAELAAASCLEARRIWDCCAAPGGKTMVLARRHPEAEVLATDVSARRVRALAERLAGTKVRVVEADATRLEAAEGEFDLVLCDVPCSGTGTLARNPEIKLRLEPAELGRQARRQREILAAALGRVAPGGRLVYSTCSLEPEENERVVEGVCAEGGFAVVGVGSVLRRLRESGVLAAGVEVDGLVRGEFLRTLPGVGFAGDGFFAAVLARKG